MKKKILTPLASSPETKVFSVRAPKELLERLQKVNSAARSAGFFLGINEALVKNLALLVKNAERELEEIKKIEEQPIAPGTEPKHNDASTMSCPECDGQLVERNGARGSFLGCSNYPRCGYTKNS